MNPGSEDPRSENDPIESKAAAWLMEEESGLSPEHAAEFQQWCAEDPRHAAAVAQLRTAWGEMLRLQNYRPGAQLHPDPELLAPAPRRLVRPSFIALGAAAAIVLATVTWVSSARVRGYFRDDGARYMTAAGGFNRTSLPDGSVLTLNANSEAHVKFSGKQRLVLLLRGEGHFVVAHETERPFIVEANGLHVRAVGTEFNVRTANRAVEVLVTHGRVKLAAAAGAVPPDAPTLDAGQRIVLTDPQSLPPDRALPVTIEPVSLEDVRAALAWQSPQLHFVNATLADVARQFNQRSHLQIILADPELGSIPIGGSFRPENVEAFVRLLASANEVTVERPDATRIILRRAAKR